MGRVGKHLREEFGTNFRERRAFVRESGGRAALRKVLNKEGSSGLTSKISSFKKSSRPGQNNNNPNPKNPSDPKNPESKDSTKPDANKEWGKVSDKEAQKKLADLRSSPKHYKKFDAKGKDDAIAKINNIHQTKDLAGLRGLTDKALDGQKLSPQELLSSLGAGKKGEMLVSGKVNKDGKFGLFRLRNPEIPFAEAEVQEDGSLKFSKLKPRAGDKEREMLEDKIGSIKSMDQLKSFSLLYKGFEANDKTDAINQINRAGKSSDQPVLAGVIDKVLDQSLSGLTETQRETEKLSRLGFSADRKPKLTIGLADKDGQFKVHEGHSDKEYGSVQIQDNGSFKFQKAQG